MRHGATRSGGAVFFLAAKRVRMERIRRHFESLIPKNEAEPSASNLTNTSQFGKPTPPSTVLSSRDPRAVSTNDYEENPNPGHRRQSFVARRTVRAAGLAN